jgi:hypothetical protein
MSIKECWATVWRRVLRPLELRRAA